MASQGGSSCSFKDWLTGYLNDWGLDGEVYGEYISGTFESLEDNATIEEEQAALADVLDGLVTSDNLDTIFKAIQEQWRLRNPSSKSIKKSHPQKSLNLEEHVKKATQATPISPPTQTPKESTHITDEEKRKVLMYSCKDIDEETADTDVSINENKSIVSTSLKEQRDEQRLSHIKKLEADKRNRELQKERQLERKEKEKKRTQKQERKR